MRSRIAALIVLSSAILLGACDRTATPTRLVAAGDAMPRIAFTVLGAVDVPDAPGAGAIDGSGRITLINFWASWCEPCRREMASLECLHRSSDDVVVRGVSVDADPYLALEFVRGHRLSFANASDPGGRQSRARLGIEALPATLVVDADGTVIARVEGSRDWSDPAVLEGYGLGPVAARVASATACSSERS